MLNQAGAPIFDSTGRFTGSQGAVHDVTSQKALALRTERLAQIVESAHEAIIGEDIYGIITSWNRGAERIYGYAASEALGRNIAILATEGHTNETALLIQRVITGERITGLETRRRRKDGVEIDIALSMSLVTERDGTPVGISAISRDITAEKAAARELAVQTTILLTEHEVSPDGILVVDQAGRILSKNDHFLEMWGVPKALADAGPDEPVLAFVRNQIADPEAFFARVKYLYAHPEDRAFEEVALRDGRVFQRYTAPMRTAAGDYIGRVWFFRDITEQKASVRLLDRERRNLSTIFESVADGIFVSDINTGTFLQVNSPGAALFGYSCEELVGRAIIDISAKAPEEARTDIARIRADDATVARYFEWHCKRRDGSTFWAAISVKQCIIDDNLRDLAIVRDITARKAVEEALLVSTWRFQSMVEHAPEALMLYDADSHTLVDANPEAERLFGVGKAQMIERGLPSFYAPEQPDSREIGQTMAEHNERALAGETVVFDRRIRSAQGKEAVCQVRLVKLPSLKGRLLRASFIDITESRKAAEALKFANTLLASEIESAPDGVLAVDIATGRASYNANFAAIWNLPAQEPINEPDRILAWCAERTANPESFRADVERFRDDPEASVERELTLRDGRILEFYTGAMRGGAGKPLGRISFFRDITARKRAQEKVEYMAQYDALTGLANRRGFVESLDRAIGHAKRSHTSLAVLYLDLDHFKDVNDTLGHPVGDMLLQGVAQRLKNAVRESDVVSRFGGDEFAVIAADLAELGAAAVLADTLLKTVREPFQIGGNEIRTASSIGIAAYGDDSASAETMLTHADVALYRAKAEGRGSYRYFVDSMDAEVRRRVQTSIELRDGIERGELFLMYQPQVDTGSGEIVGIEALLRWRHPQRGLVAPSEFIPIAEKSGLIVALGRWVMNEACRQMRVWLDAGIAPALIAVNLSGLQFKTPLELEKEIYALLERTGVPPGRLELELTESILMDASRAHNDVLARLQAKGMRTSIDDFGTGYSSLDYLRRFPVDRIKIAQEFVAELTTKPGNAAIVRASIGLARELGIALIVEGVENRTQFELLKSWGCAQVQGYYYSRPLTADAATAALATRILVPREAERTAAA